MPNKSCGLAAASSRVGSPHLPNFQFTTASRVEAFTNPPSTFASPPLTFAFLSRMFVFSQATFASLPRIFAFLSLTFEGRAATFANPSRTFAFLPLTFEGRTETFVFPAMTFEENQWIYLKPASKAIHAGQKCLETGQNDSFIQAQFGRPVGIARNRPDDF